MNVSADSSSSPAQIEPGPKCTWTPANPRRWTPRPAVEAAPVEDAPAALTAIPFLTPINAKASARKTHRLVMAGDGLPRLITTGYGGADGAAKALRFTHRTSTVADIEALFDTLRFQSQFNSLAIRGQVRPDAARIIFRRLAEENADIIDTPSRLIVVDLDHEVAPDWLDTDDDLAVGEYLRSQLPAELRDVSCVVQFSNSYGLWRLEPGRKKELKAHVWLLNDEPMTGPALRRWFTEQNRIGDCARLDETMASANQAIYSSAPVFEDCVDPVPRRLFLLLSDTGRDVATIRPPAATKPVVYAPGAIGERQPEKLSALVAAIRRAVEEGRERHPVINAAAFTAGRMIKGGAFTPEEALAALMPAALDSGSAGADRAVMDGLQAGMTKGAPILIGGPQPAEPDNGLSADVAAALLRDELTAWLECDRSSNVAIKGAAGLGKTTVAAALIAERIDALAARTDSPVAVTFYVKTVKNALEIRDRLPAGMAVVIRGRTHGLKQIEGDVSMTPPCKKAEAAQVLIDNQQGRYQQKLLCGKQHADGSWQCPHSAGCEYHAQFKTGAKIELRTHNWLTLGGDADFDSATVSAVAIVDEDPSAAFESTRTWTLAQCAEAGGLFNEVAQAVRDGTLTHADYFERIKAELVLQPPFEKPPVWGGMDADKARRELGRWIDRQRDAGPREPWGLLRRAFEVVQTGQHHRLYAHTGEKGTEIHWAGLKHLTARAQRFAFLDAGLNIDIVRRILPALSLNDIVVRAPVKLVEINCKRNATYLQVQNAALSGGRLKANAAHLDQRIAELTRRMSASNPAGALIGPKDFVALLNGNGALPVPTAHFGALRGLNTLESADWLILVGRHELPWWAVEKRARCWFAGQPDFNPTGAARKQQQLAGKHGTAAVEVTVFEDCYCQAMLESTREQESRQAIDRLRLVHAKTPKQIILLSNQPLPGIRPDALCNLNALLMPGRFAAVMNRDGAVTGAALLAERHPDLYPCRKDAENDWEHSSIPKSPNSTYIGNLGIEALVTVAYRTAKQRGGKARKALLYSSADYAAVLSRIHGDDVVIILSAGPDAAASDVAVPAPDVVAEIRSAAYLPTGPDGPPPPPPPETPTMPKVGNIVFMLGCPFDADWETPMPPHFGMECETRFTDWRVWFADGNTATIREPEPTTAAEFWVYAKSLTSAVKAAPVRVQP